MNITIKLTQAEINHLLAHLQDNGKVSNKEYDWYYGDKEQFANRHEKLKKKLKLAELKNQED